MQTPAAMNRWYQPTCSHATSCIHCFSNKILCKPGLLSCSFNL